MVLKNLFRRFSVRNPSRGDGSTAVMSTSAPTKSNITIKKKHLSREASFKAQKKLSDEKTKEDSETLVENETTMPREAQDSDDEPVQQYHRTDTEEDLSEEEELIEEQEDAEEDTNFVGGLDFDTKEGDERDFSCLSPDQIMREQEKEIKVVSDLLAVTASDAAALLRFFQWKKEKLLAKYLENPEQVRKEAGLNSSSETGKGPIEGSPVVSSTVRLIGEEMCSICAEDVPAEDCTALACLHRFCNQCWKTYLTMKIQEGEASRIKCPHMKCHLIVPEEAVKELVDSDVYDKFIRFVTKSFVEDSDGRVKWCPAPGCGNAVTSEMIKGMTVKCSCGYRFCFSCHREAHSPATCEQVKLWEKKCRDDSETLHWKYANTKECPKCDTPVEKNGGCNHMTCRQCKHEWCWVCIRPWKGHNDYYNCNKFVKQEKKQPSLVLLFKKNSKKEKLKQREEEKERHRLALERYLHFYERYVNHAKSSEFEKQLRNKADAKMTELQQSEATTSSEVAYIKEGTEVLLECRQALKYTYVVAYYLPETGSEKELFEYLQEDIEKTTEQLSEILEMPSIGQVHRLKALNLIQLAKTRLNNLLNPKD